jgi:hypothetical protein
MERPLTLNPAAGPVLTLDDLRDFVAEAYSKGFPGTATPRFMGAVEFNFNHGPRASRVTIVPGEESPA